MERHCGRLRAVVRAEYERNSGQRMAIPHRLSAMRCELTRTVGYLVTRRHQYARAHALRPAIAGLTIFTRLRIVPIVAVPRPCALACTDRAARGPAARCPRCRAGRRSVHSLEIVNPTPNLVEHSRMTRDRSGRVALW